MLIYFISDRSDESFYNIDMEIWEETKVLYDTEKKSSFSLKERIHLFRSTNMDRYHTSEFRIEIGKDHIYTSNSKTIPDFLKEKTTEYLREFKEVGSHIYKSKRAEILPYSADYYPID